MTSRSAGPDEETKPGRPRAEPGHVDIREQGRESQHVAPLEEHTDEEILRSTAPGAPPAEPHGVPGTTDEEDGAAAPAPDDVEDRPETD